VTGWSIVTVVVASGPSKTWATNVRGPGCSFFSTSMLATNDPVMSVIANAGRPLPSLQPMSTPEFAGKPWPSMPSLRPGAIRVAVVMTDGV